MTIIKYEVHNYTLEKRGYEDFDTSDLFDTYDEALYEIKSRKTQDKIFGVIYEYYIHKVYINI